MILFAVLSGMFLMFSALASLFPTSEDKARIDAGKDKRKFEMLKKNYAQFNRKKWMGILACGTHVFVAIAFSARYYEIGEFDKTCIDGFVNYGFFALLAIAAGINGYLMSVFFQLRTGGAKAFLALAWTVVFVLFTIGSLGCRNPVRDWAFALAVIGQAVSIAAIVYSAEMPQFFTHLKTYVVGFFLVVGLIIFDTFWYIGLYNEPSTKAILNSAFSTQLAMLIGGCLPFFTLSAFFGIILYGADYLDMWQVFTTEEQSKHMLTEEHDEIEEADSTYGY
jgi:hypothetical protein